MFDIVDSTFIDLARKIREIAPRQNAVALRGNGVLFDVTCTDHAYADHTN